MIKGSGVGRILLFGRRGDTSGSHVQRGAATASVRHPERWLAGQACGSEGPRRMSRSTIGLREPTHHALRTMRLVLSLGLLHTSSPSHRSALNDGTLMERRPEGLSVFRPRRGPTSGTACLFSHQLCPSSRTVACGGGMRE
jgi:hypothetical protein